MSAKNIDELQSREPIDDTHDIATTAESEAPPAPFRVHENHRFMILVIGSFGCICASFSYAFNLVSPQMQARFNYSQRQMSTITTVGLVVQYFVIPYAFLYDYLGPVPTALLGSMYFVIGTLLLAQCFAGNIDGSVVRLCVFNAFMGLGCSLFDLTNCMTVISCFPANKGPVTALLKTFTGLGSAIVGSIYLGIVTDLESYYYFLMVVTIFVGQLCVAFMRLPTYHLTGYQQKHLPEDEKERRLSTKMAYLSQKPPVRRFYFGFAILVFLIIYLPLESALVTYLELDQSYKQAFAIVAIIVTLLYICVAIPFPFFKNPSEEEEAALENPTQLIEGGNITRESEGETEEDQFGAPVKPTTATAVVVPAVVEAINEVDFIAPQYQGTFLENILTIELWALWATVFCVVGTALVIIFNAYFILGALSGESPSQNLNTLLTVLNGVGSAVGRLGMAYFEVWSQKRRPEDRVPITICLFFPTAAMIITIVLFLSLPSAALPLPYFLAAMGNGFLAATIVLVTRTIYAKDVAKHYNFCFTATMTASLVLNRFLYGEWYTVQAEKLGNAKTCLERRCVTMPLLVLLGLALLAFVSDVFVHLRYRSMSQRVLAERRQLREMAAAAVEGEAYPLEADI